MCTQLNLVQYNDMIQLSPRDNKTDMVLEGVTLCLTMQRRVSSVHLLIIVYSS